MSLFYAPLVVLALWSAFGAYVFLTAPKTYRTRWLMIPASLVAAALYGFVLFNVFGYAVPLELPDEFDFLAYHVVIEGSKKTAIEIWIETTGTRLYVIPYSKQAEERLKQAAADKRAGNTVRMKRKGNGQGRGKGDREGPPGDQSKGSIGGRDDYPYESNLLLPPSINPKSEVPSTPDEAPRMNRSWT